MWRIPPGERMLTDEGVHVYVECDLPLEDHYTIWCWLHNLITREEAAERLVHEVELYLEFLAEI
jgi:hypothetical protein